jgi:hypothetical protein
VRLMGREGVGWVCEAIIRNASIIPTWPGASGHIGRYAILLRVDLLIMSLISRV